MAKKKDKEFNPAKIKVVGVGGGGGNAISRMYEEFPKGVDLIAVNTDIQDLENTEARKKIHIGKNITRGLGAGMNPDLGRQAAEEDREEIFEAMKGADIIFITAGFGGGTGTGASPIVADIAKELGILTVAVVTKPFGFEGAQRARIAEEGVSRIKDKVDALITIPNDRIFSIISKDTSLLKAFTEIDEVLKNSVQGIAELIMSPGIINVDFADVRAIMKNAGSAIIGIGIAGGQGRASKAANLAVSSPLLDMSVDGAKGVLFSVSGHRDLRMTEINDIAKIISENVDDSAKIIFGAYSDRKIKPGQLKVTLIATGFNSLLAPKNNISISNLFLSSKPSEAAKEEEISSEKSEEENKTNPKQGKLSVPDFDKRKNKTGKSSREDKEKPGQDSGDVWDIPAFLRRKKN